MFLTDELREDNVVGDTNWVKEHLEKQFEKKDHEEEALQQIEDREREVQPGG